MTQDCPLCKSKGKQFYHYRKQLHYGCSNCNAIFVDRNLLYNASMEMKHYEKHNNDVEDKGYQNFVAPITNAIRNDFTYEHVGLDFGAGTGPVISKLLSDMNYQIHQYDPYFHKHPELLNKQYDYIVCCEVMEHFYRPHQEFQLLKSLLKPNGKLYCMTFPYHKDIDFHEWYYKNDPTHVFIYTKETLVWIQKEFGFTDVTIDGRLIVFTV